MLQCSETGAEGTAERTTGPAGPTIRAYLRVSTRKQADAAGVDSQRAAIERWAAGRPVVWYEDSGRSGATMDRDEWQRLLADIRRGDTIGVYDLSRVSRDSLDIIAWARDMLDLGGTSSSGYLAVAAPARLLPELLWTQIRDSAPPP